MQSTHSKGFTLIELLVVIALIGILAAVVLAAVNTARTRGNDAGIKQKMTAIRSQSEITNTANQYSYATLCTDITAILNNLRNNDTFASTANNTTWATAGAGGTITCHSTSTAWAVEAPMSSGFWCIDNTGFAGTTSASTLGVADAACN